MQSQYNAWIPIWLTILSIIVIPAVRGLWNLSTKQALMEQEQKTLRDECNQKHLLVKEEIRQTQEDLAMETEGGKMQQRQLNTLVEQLARIDTNVGILVNRAGYNSPQSPPHP